MGWFHLSHLLFQMIFISILLYNLCVTQLTFVKFVVLHLLALESLLFLYLCDACCDHVEFLFFIFVVSIRVSGVGVLLCFVGNVFFVSDTGKRVLRTLPRPTRTGGYKFSDKVFIYDNIHSKFSSYLFEKNYLLSNFSF